MATPLPQPLMRGPIVAARRLSPDRPVFLIDYRVSPTTVSQFVVKADRNKGGTHEDKNSMQTSIMLMREAARGARGRVLTEVERRNFLDGARPLLASAADQTYLDSVRDMGASQLWLLMGFKDGLVDLQGMIDAPDVLQACQVLLSLREEENLDRLGRIIAVDLFTSNNDRFVYRPDHKGNVTGIQNKGNIFFVDKGNGKFKIKGLDVFDPSSNTAVMTTVVKKGCDKFNPLDEDYWSGPVLKDKVRSRKVAQNALDSLYDYLGDILRNAGYPEPLIRNYKFTKEHTEIVLKGMDAALVVIKASCKWRLAQMRAGKVNTEGLKSRMKAMGWST